MMCKLRVDEKGGIMMCKLKGQMDKGGHYDVEMKGWIQKGWMDGWMNSVLGHFYALSRLNWAGDHLD